jgi:hypothetical protein
MDSTPPPVLTLRPVRVPLSRLHARRVYARDRRKATCLGVGIRNDRARYQRDAPVKYAPPLPIWDLVRRLLFLDRLSLFTEVTECGTDFHEPFVVSIWP